MATSSVSQFKYQPEKITKGNVFHYIKSNLDSTYPARIYIRVVDHENLDVWKFEEHNYDAAHVTAHMDWGSFSADQIRSWVVTSDGNAKEQAVLTSTHREALFSVSLSGQTETIQVGHYPTHVYNFDFISMIFSLCHWVDPQGEVEIGVIQPNFDPNMEGVIKYQGTVKLKYLGDEERQSQPCRKYSIGGEGIKDHKGLIWLDRNSMHAVDMEIPVPDNPDWDNFKFKFISINTMSDENWKKLIDGEIKKLSARAPTQD